MPAAPSGVALLWRLGTATTLVMVAFAMAGPVLAILLQQAGHGTAFVGAFSMLPFLMVGLLMPVMPRVLRRWGSLRCYRAGAALQFAGMLGYVLSDQVAVWAPCSILGGCGAAAMWNTMEALLAEEAPPEMRGRIMGLYQTVLGAALALGPFLPGLLQLQARAALWLAVVLMAACLLLSLTARSHAPHGAAREHTGTWQAMRAVPWLVVLAFCGGVFEAGLNAVGAAHAAGSGLGLGAAASVAGAIGVGSFLLQYPSGWAADRCPLRALFTAGAAALLASSVALAFAERAPWVLWASGLVWGGMGGALYMLAMVQVARTFAGRATAGGTAAMISGYTWGGTLGPVASGSALEAGGITGLSAWLALLALAALVAARRAPR